MTMNPPEIGDIRQAAISIAGVAVRTALVRSPGLSRLAGREIWLKPETLQLTGSFKVRGATNFISNLVGEERARGVVAYSSGNHAQGVAAAANLAGLPATIVMPSDAPVTKLERTRAWGATVVTYDRDTEDREEIAADIARANGAAILPPYDHPWTIAGQGTVGLEIATDAHAIGLTNPIVVVPASGGGLAAGIGLALEADLPQATLHLAEPVGFDDHALSLSAGHRVRIERTSGSICDALLSQTPGEITFAVNSRLAAASHAVDDMAVIAAIRAAFEEARLVVEPGGAVGLAAALGGLLPGDGPVVVVLSGGNIDRDLLMKAMG